jgi:hypothetical protein
MSNILKKAALAAALVTASLSANAAESHITVYTNVDPSLALMKQDGTALPDSIALDHVPGQGLNTHNERVRIYTNDEDKDVEVRLGHAPSLVPKSGIGAAVPLTVSLNKLAWTTPARCWTCPTAAAPGAASKTSPMACSAPPAPTQSPVSS